MMASNRPPAGGNPPMGGANVLPAPVPTGGAGANAPAPPVPGAHTGLNGNLKAGKINGPIQVSDPLNQIHHTPGATYQPLKGNIARVLDSQAQAGQGALSGDVFTPEHENYIVNYLRVHHTTVYDRIAPMNSAKIRW